MATSTLPETSTILESPEAAPEFSLLDIRRRITVDEYLRIFESGILGHEPRVELLEGMIVNKEPQTIAHVFSRNIIGEVLHHVLPRGPGYFISMSSSLRIDDKDSMPDPDAAIFRGAIRDYSNRWRTPADAAIVIEASDTRYDADRTLKWSLYAASGVPVYWILDVNRKRLEIHSEPTGQGETAAYAKVSILGPDDEVPLVLDGREVGRFPMREIMP